MFVSKVKNQRGFSLVELMVVVAIIGVLAAVAVPNITKYIAKARQTEAKTNLAGLYGAEKAFYSEYNIYDNRFGAVGYAPEGSLRYDLGFTGGTTADAANGYTITPTVTAIRAAAFCGAAGVFSNGCTMINGATDAAPPAVAAAACTASSTAPAGCVTASGTFMAGASAVITSAGGTDSWAIDSAKELRNTQDGLN